MRPWRARCAWWSSRPPSTRSSGRCTSGPPWRARARSRATAAQARVIDRYLGDPLLDEAGTAEIRAAITGTGAVAECERMIGRHVSEAIAALEGAPMTGEAREALAELAVAATTRDG